MPPLRALSRELFLANAAEELLVFVVDIFDVAAQIGHRGKMLFTHWAR